MKDILLLKLIKKDDELAFKELFESYFTPLCRFVFQFIKDDSSAKEIVLDLFLYIWENRDKIEIETSFKSYIFRSARNRSLNFLRNVTNTFSLQDVTEDRLPVDHSVTENQEIVGLELLIQEAIMALPDKCRIVFDKSRKENLSNQEIASQMQITVKAVEGHITRALKRIRKQLEENYYLLL